MNPLLCAAPDITAVNIETTSENTHNQNHITSPESGVAPSLLWGQVLAGSWARFTLGIWSGGGGLRSADPWGHLAHLGSEPGSLPHTLAVMLRGALATACMEEEQDWATWAFKVRNCQSTCLGSCDESDSGDSQGAPQGRRVLAGLALAQVDDVVRVFCDHL